MPVPPPVPSWEISPLRDPVHAENPLDPEWARFMARRAARHVKGTKRSYTQAWTYFRSWLVATGRPLTLGVISRGLFEDYRDYQLTRRPDPRSHSKAEHLTPDAVNTYLRPLQALCHFLVLANYLTINPFDAEDRSDSILPYVSPEGAIVRKVTGPELERLCTSLREARDLLAGRDLAILELGWTTGLRNSDLRRLKVDSLQWERGEAEVRESKWKRDGVVLIDPQVAPHLEHYLAAVRPRLVARLARKDMPDPGWLFVSEAAGSRRNPGGQLEESTIAQILTRRWQAAGMTGHFGPHRLRHGLASLLADAGVPLEVIQRWLGHSTLAVTQRYARMSRRAVVNVVRPAMIGPLSAARPASGLREVA